MRRIGTDGWAGLAMLVVSIGVAAPTLLGMMDPVIPRIWWTLLFAGFLTATLAVTSVRRPAWLRYASFAVAVVAAWAAVLTAQTTGLLLILLVVTAATSVYVVPLRIGLVVVVLNTVVVAVASASTASDPVETLILVGFYFLIQAAALLSSATLAREQRLRQELADAHVELQAASILLSESARTAERLRISRELHDLIGHQLTVLTLELETARHVDVDDARAHLDRADRVARDLLGDVRTTVGRLRTESPDLERSLRAMTAVLPGLDVSISISPRLNIGEQQSAALIRAAQEIVTNTLRHADARELHLEVAVEHDDVILVARDDGQGAAQPTPGNGLRGLQERFAELGGTVTLDGRQGFEVVARMPSS